MKMIPRPALCRPCPHLQILSAADSDLIMSAPVVVFDLDGTLVDSAPDLIGTLNLLLLREGLDTLPLAEGIFRPS